MLTAGEVIGEMAYFNGEGKQKRSCAASAIIPTEVIEISFLAFEKTITNLNPWIRTIVLTLASRLRKANDKIKELDTNSVSISYGNSKQEYIYFRSSDVVKLLAVFYLIPFSTPKDSEGKVVLSLKGIKFYIVDIFAIHESKLEDFLILLEELQLIEQKSKEDLDRDIVFNDLRKFKDLLLFYNQQRILPDEKKITVTEKCQQFLGKILEQVEEKKLDKEKSPVNLSEIIQYFKDQNISVGVDDLDDAKLFGFITDVMVGSNNNLNCMANVPLIKRSYFPLIFINKLKKLNQSKRN